MNFNWFNWTLRLYSLDINLMLFVNRERERLGSRMNAKKKSYSKNLWHEHSIWCKKNAIKKFSNKCQIILIGMTVKLLCGKNERKKMASASASAYSIIIFALVDHTNRNLCLPNDNDNAIAENLNKSAQIWHIFWRLLCEPDLSLNRSMDSHEWKNWRSISASICFQWNMKHPASNVNSIIYCFQSKQIMEYSRKREKKNKNWISHRFDPINERKTNECHLCRCFYGWLSLSNRMHSIAF